MAAIESVIQNSGITIEKLEFIIIDNSQDFQATWIEPLTSNFVLIEPGYNSGFARAVNMGLKAATKEFVCLMNQDACLITANTFGILIEQTMNLPNKTILGCSLQDENGNFQQSVWIDNPGLLKEWKKGPINCKINRNWQLKFENKLKKAHENSGFVYRINGAFLFWKKPTDIQELFFDEDFFLYGEDIEWAIRIKRKNWKFYHYHEFHVKHIGSASSSSNEQVKHNQIEIMDWLSILKLKGRIYLNLYLQLKLFNKWLDHYLAIRAKSNNNIIDKLQKDIFLLRKQKRYFVKTIKSQKNLAYFEAFNLYKESLNVVE